MLWAWPSTSSTSSTVFLNSLKSILSNKYLETKPFYFFFVCAWSLPKYFMQFFFWGHFLYLVNALDFIFSLRKILLLLFLLQIIIIITLCNGVCEDFQTYIWLMSRFIGGRCNYYWRRVITFCLFLFLSLFFWRNNIFFLFVNGILFDSQLTKRVIKIMRR